MTFLCDDISVPWRVCTMSDVSVPWYFCIHAAIFIALQQGSVAPPTCKFILLYCRYCPVEGTLTCIYGCCAMYSSLLRLFIPISATLRVWMTSLVASCQCSIQRYASCALVFCHVELIIKYALLNCRVEMFSMRSCIRHLSVFNMRSCWNVCSALL